MISDIQVKQSVIQANRSVIKIRLILCVRHARVKGIMSVTSWKRKRANTPQESAVLRTRKNFFRTRRNWHTNRNESQNPRHATVNVRSRFFSWLAYVSWASYCNSNLRTVFDPSSLLLWTPKSLETKTRVEHDTTRHTRYQLIKSFLSLPGALSSCLIEIKYSFNISPSAL